MKWYRPAVVWAGAAALAGCFGCSSDAQPGVGSSGGAAGMLGAPGPNAGAESAGSAGTVSAGGTGNAGAAAASDGCEKSPAPLRTQGTLLSLPLELVLGGKPFVFGEANELSGGSSLVPLNLRFYISEVELLRGAGQANVAVDVVTAAGAPAPYGVYLFNAEDADSNTLTLLAPPGEYTGLSFALGIKLGCNQQNPAGLSDPLRSTSQMTWPHTGGFLFFRYEARYMAAGSAGASGAPESLPAVHMGGDIKVERVPRVTVLGALSVPASGKLEKGLSVVMDEILKGATANIDVSDVAVGLLSAPEAIAGERLRRQLPDLHVFVLEP